MPSKKKESAAQPAGHDLELHAAARDAGRSEGINPVTHRRIAYAIAGCQVCEELAREGFAEFPPEDEGGRGSGDSEVPQGTTDGSGITGSPSAKGRVAVAAANPVPVTIIDEPEAQVAIRAVFEAAEAFKPGLAEKLGPLVEMGLREYAKVQALEQAEAEFKRKVIENLDLLKGGMEVLHNNIAHIYGLISGTIPPAIRKVG